MLHVRSHSDILRDDFNGVCHNSDGLPSQFLSRYRCQISKVSKILPKFWCKFYFIFLLQNVIVWNNALKKFIDMCTLILRCTNIILWLRLMRSEPFKDVIRRHPKLKVLRRINSHYLTQTSKEYLTTLNLVDIEPSWLEEFDQFTHSMAKFGFSQCI